MTIALTESSGARRPKRARVSSIAGDARWISYGQIQSINKRFDFHQLQPQDLARIEQLVMTENAPDMIEHVACCVTGRWVLRRDSITVPIDEIPLLAMQATLGAKTWTTDDMQAFYDCSSIHSRLSGFLLCSDGVRGSGRHVVLCFLSSTLKELKEIQASMELHPEENPLPPRFSIADGFVAGNYPEIDAATTIEKQTVALAQMRGVVKVVYGDPGNMLQSHLLCWDNRNSTIATQVPNVLRRENFEVILAGPITSCQQILLSKKHECNGERVFKLLELLRRINHLYRNVTVNTTFNASISRSSCWRYHCCTE